MRPIAPIAPIAQCPSTPAAASINMVGSLMFCCTTTAVVMGRLAKAPRRAFAASPAAALRAKPMAARRSISTTVVAQALEKRVIQEGNGASPQQGDKVSLPGGCKKRSGAIGAMCLGG